MNIGKPVRVFTIEPLKDPVPRPLPERRPAVAEAVPVKPSKRP